LGPEKNITAELACSDGTKAMQNKVWIVAKGECLLRFKPDAAVGAGPVNFTVMAAALDSSQIPIGLTEDQVGRVDDNPISVTIALNGNPSSRSEAGLGGTPVQTAAERLRPAVLIFCVIMVVTTIVLFLFSKYKRGIPSPKDESRTNDFTQDETRPSSRQASAPLPRTGKIPIQDVVRPPVKQSPVELLRQETTVEQTLREHSKLLLDLSSRGRSLESRIDDVADQCIAMLSQSTQQADQLDSERRNDTTRRMHDVESRIDVLQRQLSEHLASQSSRLQDLFKDLPSLAELSTAARITNKSELSRLEDNLVSAIRGMVLPTERLEALQDESSGLLDAIQEFVRAAESTNRDHVKKRLGRVIESTRVVNNELFTLGQLVATHKHGFVVEISLLEQNHLAEDLAAALTRETMKVSDPEGFYVKRLEALKTHACVGGIDLADLDVDAERRNGALQQALLKLLQTLGMIPIDPHQNDKLQPADHQVVQFVRRLPGVQPGAIAHTMARGLQRGGEVIRKASVLLFE
jgi:hypothetical protein